MPRALSQRASQKPSRPASKATAMRSILRPAFSASSRHRCSSFSNALSSTASFFNGWRSTPGTIPATSQLDRLISMTAISVPFGSRAVRDRLRSFNFCMGRSIGSHQRRWNAISSPPPHSIFHQAGPHSLPKHANSSEARHGYAETVTDPDRACPLKVEGRIMADDDFDDLGDEEQAALDWLMSDAGRKACAEWAEEEARRSRGGRRPKGSPLGKTGKERKAEF